MLQTRDDLSRWKRLVLRKTCVIEKEYTSRPGLSMASSAAGK